MSAPRLHPTASVDPVARLGPNVVVGPYAVIGPGVALGDGTVVGAHAVLEGDTALGRGCVIGVGAALGGAPQDRRYGGRATRLEIGEDTVIREYTTVNRGSHGEGITRIGHRCFLMTYVHVGHDCVIEDDVTIANAVQLGGHVHVEAGVTLGGTAAVQQFVRIGTLAFVGGGTRVVQDVPPYTRAAGDPLRLYGINAIGLTRAGVSADVRDALKRAFRLIFNSDLTPREASALVRERLGHVPEIERLVAFLERAEHGVPV